MLPNTRPRDASLRAREPSRSREEKATHTTKTAISTRFTNAFHIASTNGSPVPRGSRLARFRLHFCHAEPYRHCYLSSAARTPARLSSKLVQNSHAAGVIASGNAACDSSCIWPFRRFRSSFRSIVLADHALAGTSSSACVRHDTFRLRKHRLQRCPFGSNPPLQPPSPSRSPSPLCQSSYRHRTRPRLASPLHQQPHSHTHRLGNAHLNLRIVRELEALEALHCAAIHQVVTPVVAAHVLPVVRASTRLHGFTQVLFTGSGNVA